MDQHIILGVEPWQELYYNNCFYPPLLTAISYLRGNVFPFLINDFFCYSYNEKDPVFRISCSNIKIEKDVDILYNMGINVLEITDITIAHIKELLLKNTPILFQIDRFYWKHESNDDFFSKAHMPHTLLLYGYNNNTLYAQDADSQAGIKQKKVDAANLINALDRTPPSGLPSVFGLKRRNTCYYTLEYYKSHFFNNLNGVVKEMRASLTSISMAVSYYHEKIQSPNDILAHKKLFFSSMSFKNLETAKKMEKYRLLKFHILDEKMEQSINSCYLCLNIIKGTLMKAVIKEQYNSDIFEKLSTYLNNLQDNENIYLDSLLELSAKSS